MRFFLLVSLVVALAVVHAITINPAEDLRCEYLEQALGVDTLTPLLSWVPGRDWSGSRGIVSVGFEVTIAESFETAPVPSRLPRPLLRLLLRPPLSSRPPWPAEYSLSVGTAERPFSVAPMTGVQWVL